MTPKEECEELMRSLLPFARRMLAEYQEFLPYGGTMSPSGEIVHVGASTGEEHPKSATLVEIMENTFRDGAANGKFKVTAIVVDVLIEPPGKTAKQDAVEVRLDHRDGYSVRVVFPYAFSDSGELLVEAPFASRGQNSIFS